LGPMGVENGWAGNVGKKEAQSWASTARLLDKTYRRKKNKEKKAATAVKLSIKSGPIKGRVTKKFNSKKKERKEGGGTMDHHNHMYF